MTTTKLSNLHKFKVHTSNTIDPQKEEKKDEPMHDNLFE